ncbi:hypothetical protein [Streptomyces sp. NPDC051569]|uniref:hypothetical protein n=1 Tax=Streptomyces sp. NPDC051569 TaxID=3365661 RepID=UPI00378B4372
MAKQTPDPADPSTVHGGGVSDEALEPAQLRSLNSALRKLADGGGEANSALRESAQKLLSGRLTLRDALDDPSASRGLLTGTASLRSTWDALSEEERAEVRERGAERASAPGSVPGPVPESGHASEPERPSGGSEGPGKKASGRHRGGFSLYL